MGTRGCRATPTLTVLKWGWLAILVCAALAGTSPRIDAAPPGDESAYFTGAAPRSASMLYSICEAEADRPLNWCEGYLLGLADVLVAMGNSRMDGGICDAEYEPATLGRIFKVWVERHPDKSQEDMMIAAQAAFRQVWPCK
jgi:hypothetical protein